MFLICCKSHRSILVLRGAALSPAIKKECAGLGSAPKVFVWVSKDTEKLPNTSND
jgi:hypothetical protein